MHADAEEGEASLGEHAQAEESGALHDQRGRHVGEDVRPDHLELRGERPPQCLLGNLRIWYLTGPHADRIHPVRGLFATQCFLLRTRPQNLTDFGHRLCLRPG